MPLSEQDQRSMNQWSNLGSLISNEIAEINSPTERVRLAAAQYAPKGSTEYEYGRSPLPRDQFMLKKKLAKNNRAVLQKGTDKVNMYNDAKQRLAMYKDLEQDLQAQKIKQAAGVSEKKVITTDPDGKVTEKTEIRGKDGSEISIKKVNENPYQDQYEDLLNQGINQEQRLNLQPLAQLVDQWSGSNFTPQFQDPNRQQAQLLANKIKYAGALAGEGQKPIDAATAKKIRDRDYALKLRQVMGQEARAKVKDKGDKDKYLDIVNRSKIGDDKAVEYRGLQDVLRMEDNKKRVMSGLSRDKGLQNAGIRIPRGWDAPIKAIMTTTNPKDVAAQKKSMLETMVQNARADGFSWQEIDEQKFKLSNDIDNKIAEITAVLGAQ